MSDRKDFWQGVNPELETPPLWAQSCAYHTAKSEIESLGLRNRWSLNLWALPNIVKYFCQKSQI